MTVWNLCQQLYESVLSSVLLPWPIDQGVLLVVPIPFWSSSLPCHLCEPRLPIISHYPKAFLHVVASARWAALWPLVRSSDAWDDAQARNQHFAKARTTQTLKHRPKRSCRNLHLPLVILLRPYFPNLHVLLWSCTNQWDSCHISSTERRNYNVLKRRSRRTPRTPAVHRVRIWGSSSWKQNTISD